VVEQRGQVAQAHRQRAALELPLDAEVVAVVLPQVLKVEMAALVHSPVAAEAAAVQHALVFKVALAALAQQDMRRFTHGKFIWRNL